MRQYPYFRVTSDKIHFVLAKFLRRKFLPPLSRKILFPHYLLTQNTRIFLKFIQETPKKYPYFLCFDIQKYFPSINHQILLSQIPQIYQSLTGKEPSRRLKKLLKTEIPKFLSLSPYQNQGLPLGNSLSHILAGIYLLKLDLSLNLPFLRFTDDYLLFARNKQQIDKTLSETIVPILKELNLSLNFNKLKSGKFYQEKLSFLGLEFFAGYIKIPEEKIFDFKKRIVALTRLAKKKPIPAVIKLLNNKILGFGHYYKFADAKNIFKDLDGFVRSRLRRYILRNRNLFPKAGNLLLTNRVLKELGLKSLTEIKLKFDQKFKQKNGKSQKIRQKTGQIKSNLNWQTLQKISDSYLLRQVLGRVNRLIDLVEKLEKRIKKIEKELEN